MSEWKNDVIAICPESLTDVANEFSAAIGVSIADNQTFDRCLYEDSEGNKYSVIHSPMKDIALTKIESALVRPDFDTNSIDMVKAETGRGLLQWDFTDLPNKISCKSSADFHGALAEAGLTLIPVVYV